ncbi:MAG: ABC transporter substrate-binding protein, partial [Leptolyngbya sp. SIO4C5]|nr:ABC transporter substrate-binding protein [Leptolyngbya sp. SIO4C5]
GPNMLELLLALDVQPVGYADHAAFHQGDYDNPAEQIPYLGDRITTQPINVGLDYSPSTEALLRANPNLILVTENNNPQYEMLSNIAPTLVLQWDAVETNLRAIAQAVERTDQAEQQLKQMETQIAATRQALATVVASYPEIALLSSVEAQQFNLVTDRNSICGKRVQELGFQLVYPPGMEAATLNNPTIPLSLETLSQLNEADSIVLLGFNFAPEQSAPNFSEGQLKQVQQAWQENAIAQSLPASKNERVYFIPAYLCFGLPGPIGTELYLKALKEQLLAL